MSKTPFAELPPELLHRLESLAERRGISLQDLVELILAEDIIEWEIKADA